MGSKFALGKKAIGICDRCSQRFLLSKLKEEVVKGKPRNNRVCPECFDPDHPQLMLGAYPVEDPQALRVPRTDAAQRPPSRDIEWGWNPVGGARYGLSNVPNSLVTTTAVGQVTIQL